MTAGYQKQIIWMESAEEDPSWEEKESQLKKEGPQLGRPEQLWKESLRKESHPRPLRIEDPSC